MPEKRSEQFWPNPAQEALLRAIPLKGDAALHSLKEWQDLAGAGQSLDPASLHLLPLLYHRHREYLGQTELIKKCKHIHLLSAQQALLLFSKGRNVIDL